MICFLKRSMWFPVNTLIRLFWLITFLEILAAVIFFVVFFKDIVSPIYFFIFSVCFTIWLNNLYVLFERPQNHCGLRCRDSVEMWEKVFFLFYSIKGHLTKYHYSSLCKSFAQRNSSILISWLDKAFVYAKTFNYIPRTQTTSLFLISWQWLWQHAQV